MRDLTDYAEHFRQRVLQDALTEATAAYWRRRAAMFAGVGTERAREAALACRRHALLLSGGDVLADDPGGPWPEAHREQHRPVPRCRGCGTPVRLEDVLPAVEPSSAVTSHDAEGVLADA